MTSAEAVRKATGRDLDAWFSLLDGWAALEKGHKETARHLSEAHGLSGWWAQHVTVEHERARGVREVGETTRGFAASAQRTVDGGPEEVWGRVVASAPSWLGSEVPEEGHVATRTGEAEVRAFRPGELLRLRFPGKEVLHVEFERRQDRTTVRFRHEGLRDARARQQAKARWKRVLEGL